MSTLGKVLLVFVFLASLGFLYVGARAMKTQDVHRTWHKVYADALVERDDRILELNGQKLEANPLATNVPKGILQLSRELEVLLANQGRVWRDCVFAGRDNTALTVQVDNPNPHGIGDKSVLYVFEQHPQPADFADGIYSNNRPLVFPQNRPLQESKPTRGCKLLLRPTSRSCRGWFTITLRRS